MVVDNGMDTIAEKIFALFDELIDGMPEKELKKILKDTYDDDTVNTALLLLENDSRLYR